MLNMPVQQIVVKNSSEIENFEWNTVPYMPGTRHGSRAGSSSSQTSNSNSSGDICRICHCESDAQNPLLAPCYCSGSLKYVHQSCLQQWLTASDTRSCELCKFHFIMHTKIKPFNEWRRLEMSGVERRRLCCAVLFHCVAALCVMWSLFVLIDRAAEEIQQGRIAWPFWTKLMVVAVGFTGGAVFMYIQCRQYFTLCSRWRCHNRILLIQNAPEKIHAAPPSPIIHHVSVTASSNRARDINDIERANHGQVVANIENNPGNNAPAIVSCAVRQNLNEQSSNVENKIHTHSVCVFPPPSNVFVEEEDESGGFNDYRPNSFRRILTSENRDYSIVPFNRETKTKIKSDDTSDVRRYSDTRLLQTFDCRDVIGSRSRMAGAAPKCFHPIDRRLSGSREYANRNVDFTSHSEECLNDTSCSYSPYERTVYHISDKFDPTVSLSPQYEVHPQVSDIVFEALANDYDPLELNIQEMLELDVKTSQNRKKSVLSLTREQPVQCHKANNYEANKLVFKSLPNLSASSESLLPHRSNS